MPIEPSSGRFTSTERSGVGELSVDVGGVGVGVGAGAGVVG
jgi:hypothetical protein